MKKIILFLVLVTLLGCSKNDTANSSEKEKVTLEIKLPTYPNIKVSPVYLFYRNSETEKIVNNNNYEFDISKEAYINAKENISIKYHDKQSINSQGVAIFHNVPKDFVQFIVKYESPFSSFEHGQLLDLKTATKFDFSK